MPEWLTVLTSGHGIESSSPAGSELLSEPKRGFISQNPSPSLRPDLTKYYTIDNDIKPSNSSVGSEVCLETAAHLCCVGLNPAGYISVSGL